MATTDTSLIARLKGRIAAWREEADWLEKLACSQAAATYRVTADELERDLDNWENQQLSIQEASAESGYSKGALRRKVRSGHLPAERGNGKKSHIKVRRGDLPRKPQRRQTNGGTSDSSVTYNPEEDARDIAQRLGRE